jgi:hypothetical protein
MMLTRLHVMEEVQLRHLEQLRALDKELFETDAKVREAEAEKELAAAVKAAKKANKPGKYAEDDGHKRSKGEVAQLADTLKAQLVAEATLRREQFDQSMSQAGADLQQAYEAVAHNLDAFFGHQRELFGSFAKGRGVGTDV